MQEGVIKNTYPVKMPAGKNTGFAEILLYMGKLKKNYLRKKPGFFFEELVISILLNFF